MKNRILKSNIGLISLFLMMSALIVMCKKSENSARYPYGIFPDTVLNLEGLNSAYDDYNSTSSEVTGALPLIFSSNRKSTGGQFDLEQGLLTFTFNKIDGLFTLTAGMTHDAFMDTLIKKAETPQNDFGPYRAYSSLDGLEYFIVASENVDGNLDLRYFKNIPQQGGNIPAVQGPFPVKLLNTGFDDAYLSFDLSLDSAYFISNIEGNFDIYLKARPDGIDISDWFDSDYSPSLKVDSINSPYDDKCPMVYNKFMVFTSNRPGGYGGFDLYYSIFRNGNWSSPVNMGPKINSSSDEYRPLTGSFTDFENIYMIFSSNRPGGLGGYDLYFTGLDVPK
jgi:hypothetical protein